MSHAVVNIGLPGIAGLLPADLAGNVKPCEIKAYRY
jgi:hypothetical protein